MDSNKTDGQRMLKAYRIHRACRKGIINTYYIREDRFLVLSFNCLKKINFY